MHDGTNSDPRRDPAASFWQQLLYRWFVEFNPLYLLSAMLVLGGMIVSSRGLAHDGSLYGQVGVAAIAELYSAALIGGAALLVRVGQRRSAVMLALLTVLYQCDLTLHTETCPNLGWIGIAATGAWLLLFMAKLTALAWAMKLRLSRAVVATAALGALGLALLPYGLQHLESRAAGALVTLWLLSLGLPLTSLGSSAPRTVDEQVVSRVELDAWGHTVLGRAVRATWILWALLLSLHVLFWCTQYHLSADALIAVGPLLLVRWVRNESRVWSITVATLVFVALVLPGSFAVTALIAAVGLALRAGAAARSIGTAAVEAPRPMAPYRAAAGAEPTLERAPVTLVVDGRPAMRRLLAGAAFALYLSVWTIGWSGGPWPAHVLPLDVVMTAAVLLGAWRLRLHVAIAPLAGAWAHFALQARIVPAPRSLLEWGGASIVLGFALLIASLAASYWLRPRRGPSS